VHQGVAVAAYFSGLAFIGQSSTAGQSAQAASNAVTVVACILGLLSLLNLGRSFGVLIAARKVRTRGLYAVVRHPMYLSDILFRIGFVVSHVTWVTVALLVASSACYIYRAILEERFLAQQDEYREYMKKVKYRFVPFVY
jgi:protein-S-isoprenylcysteine O-methyltransferase Ste14